MNIDRNNYEEYFLLYADNELSDNEKVEVLKFVRDSQDLEEEFKMILSTVVKPTNLSAFDKTSLYRKDEATTINASNHQQFFIDYADGEAGDDDKRRVEDFVKEHPAFAEELSFFLQARLMPDMDIVYPFKQDLLKKEPAKVWTIVFWRTLAAAVIIGFGIWIFRDQVPEMQVSRPVVATEIPVKKQADPLRKDIQSADDKSTDKNEESVPGANPAKEKEDVSERKTATSNLSGRTSAKPNREVNVIPAKDYLANKNTAQPSKKDVAKSVNISTDDSKLGNDKEIVQADAAPDFSTDAVPLAKEVVAIKRGRPSRINPEQHVDANEMIAVRTALTSAEENASNNYVFYNVTAEEFRKSKVGSFLKKVKRVVFRTSPIGKLLSNNDDQTAATSF